MKGIRHTGIYVKDLKKMVSFYKDIFNLEVVVHQIEKGAYTDAIFAERDVSIEVYKLVFCDKTMIEFIHCNHTANLPDWNEKIYHCGKMHIAVTVDSAEEMYQKLKKRNCVLLSEPCISPDGRARVFFAKDLEGNYLELVEEL